MPGPGTQHSASGVRITPAAHTASEAAVRASVFVVGRFGQYTCAAADSCVRGYASAAALGAGYQGTAVADSKVSASGSQCCRSI